MSSTTSAPCAEPRAPGTSRRRSPCAAPGCCTAARTASRSCQRAAEVALLGEHADHACAAGLVLPGELGRITDGGQRALGRAATLHLGDHADAGGAQGGERVVGGPSVAPRSPSSSSGTSGLARGDVLTDTGDDLVQTSATGSGPPSTAASRRCVTRVAEVHRVEVRSRTRVSREVGSSPRSSAVHIGASRLGARRSSTGRRSPVLVARRHRRPAVPAPRRSTMPGSHDEHAADHRQHRPARVHRRRAATTVDGDDLVLCATRSRARAGLTASARPSAAPHESRTGQRDQRRRRRGAPSPWSPAPPPRRPARRARGRSARRRSSRPDDAEHVVARTAAGGTLAIVCHVAGRDEQRDRGADHHREPPARVGELDARRSFASRSAASRRSRSPGAPRGPCCASPAPRAPARCRPRRPPPACTCATPSRITAVRIAIADVEVAGRVEVADRAAVESAAHRLELVDDLHRPHLRRAGQRARRERRDKHVEASLPRRPGLDASRRCARHAVALDRHELDDPDAAGRRHPTDVVAAEVDEHHVLGRSFGSPTSSSASAGPRSACRRAAGSRRSGEDARVRPSTGPAFPATRRRCPRSPCAEVHVGRRVEVPEHAVDVERAARSRR